MPVDQIVVAHVLGQLKDALQVAAENGDTPEIRAAAMQHLNAAVQAETFAVSPAGLDAIALETVLPKIVPQIVKLPTHVRKQQWRHVIDLSEGVIAELPGQPVWQPNQAPATAEAECDSTSLDGDPLTEDVPKLNP